MEEKEARTVNVKTDTDEFVLYGRPCELSAFSYIAPNRHLSKERTYFNVEKKVRQAVNLPSSEMSDRIQLNISTTVAFDMSTDQSVWPLNMVEALADDPVTGRFPDITFSRHL